MDRKTRYFTVLILTLTLVFEIPQAQHVQILSDQQWIELGIDLLRKGIQEEDTTKINMVLAPAVSVNGEKVASAELTQRFQTLFDGAANRVMRLARPAFPRPDSPRRNSDFWDFDILDPILTINGDTAVVECELVLWGAPPDGINKGPGRKIKERLVFISPPPAQSGSDSQVPQVVETDVEGYLSNESRAWPNGPYAHNPENSRKSWRLANIEKLFLFLDEGPKQGQPNQNFDKKGK